MDDVTFFATMTFVASTTPVALLLVLFCTSRAFVTPTQSRRPSCLKAAPKRLEENVDGVLYVNDKVRVLLLILHTHDTTVIHSLTLIMSLVHQLLRMFPFCTQRL